MAFQDIDLAVAVLCRCCEVAQWSPAKAAEFLMDHPKKQEVLQVFWQQASFYVKVKFEFFRWVYGATFLQERFEFFMWPMWSRAFEGWFL